MITFTVPADFRIESLYVLKQLEERYPDNRIRELFGNLSGSRWPSGHGYLKAQRFAASLEELREYVSAAAALGYDFNYTFNSGCLQNQDILREGQKQILDFIGKLQQIGVARVTIASPVLIQAVHQAYPSLKITASAITGVDSIIRARAVETLGARTMVLQEDLTRDLGRIRSIARHTGMDVEVIVNSKCTFNCLYRTFHYNSVSHDVGEEKTVFHYGANCAAERMRDPVEFVKSLWIRPEDLQCYADCGVRLFKIIGRERLNTINIPRMVEVYFSRSYDGNLIDLLHGFSTTQKHLSLDNKKLDGFIDKFLREPFRCLDACTADQCSYCAEFAARALRTEQ